MFSYSSCVPDSAANKNVSKVYQQQCWINLPKVMLKIPFFSLCIPNFFLSGSTEQSKAKESITKLAVPYLLFVKYLEIIHRFCYRLTTNTGIFRCKQ